MKAGRRGRALAAVVVVVLLGGTMAAMAALPPGGTFRDDDGNVHEGYIEAIAAEGITKGCNPPQNDLYCPSDPVTRGQMAAFLVRALELGPSPGDRFIDDTGSVFEDDINRLATAGITRGCNPPQNDHYCPTEVVSRGEMAAFLVRARNYTDNGGGDLFVDDDTSVFEDDIDRLAAAGVAKGCNPPQNDHYCPTDPVRRDQMASFLGRALHLTADTPPPRPTTIPPEPLFFPDGVYRVGTEIEAGTYRNVGSGDTCYAARLSGFGGTSADIIANMLSDDILIVTIDPSDAGFRSSNCGGWSNDLSPRTATLTSDFGSGFYQVNFEIAPGLWQNSGGSSCYWERLSGYSWEVADIIANGLPDTPDTVRIEPGDVGFHSSGCGTWSYLGS
ncbi:MAG: S-layer homology domain-containing protein [Acidimicrobiia bacterium]